MIFGPQPLTSHFFPQFSSHAIPKGKQRLALIWALLRKHTSSHSTVLSIISLCKHLCTSITKPFGNNWSHIVMEGGRNAALCLVCTLHLVMLSSWIPPFQAETCFGWCAKGHGRSPTKRIPESWVTSVPVWQWIASASCPLIQNKKCGKPGKRQPLDRLFVGGWNSLRVENNVCELCTF